MNDADVISLPHRPSSVRWQKAGGPKKRLPACAFTMDGMNELHIQYKI
jgi:hypothetical protein